MGGIAALLLVGAVIAAVFGLFQKHKAGKIAKAPFVRTGDAAQRGESLAAKNGALSAEGSVVCSQPLVAPASGTPCLYYELEVVGKWKEGDSNKEDKYTEQKLAAQFSVDDGTGAVAIFAEGGGDFDMKETFKEKRKEGFMAGLTGRREPMAFGQYLFQNPSGSKATEFECIEKVVPVHPKLFVCGKATAGGIGRSTFSSLIMSPKSRDALLGSAAKSAKYSLIGAASAGGLGLVLGLIASLTADPTPTAVDTSAATPAIEAPAEEPTAQ